MRVREKSGAAGGKIVGRVMDLMRRCMAGLAGGTLRTGGIGIGGNMSEKGGGRWGLARLLRGIGGVAGVTGFEKKRARRNRRWAGGEGAILHTLEPKVLLSAVIATDQSDYLFGSTAYITGSGFAANEMVQLQVLHAPGTGGSNDNPQNQPWDVTADASGDVNASWVVNEPDAAGATFDLTAVGQTSGETAETEFTDSTLTAATGGSAISADTNNVNGNGTLTALTGPIYAESSAGLVGTGKIVLNAPAGFAFDTGGTAPTVKITGSNTAIFNINGVATGTSVAMTSVSSTQLVFTVTSTSLVANTLTWQNIRVRPIDAGSTLSTGNIVTSSGTGNANLSGITNGSTSFGTLTEVSGAPAAISFSQQPASATAGNALNPHPAVKVVDQFGNTESSTTNVSVVLNGGSFTSGTTTANTSAGIATFSNLVIDNAATGYTISASVNGLSSVMSNAFNIVAAGASKLGIVQGPSNSVAGQTISPSITVEILDQFGNLTTNTNNISATLVNSATQLTGNFASGSTTSIAAANGTATFSNLTVDTSASYTIGFTSSSLTGATSGSFTVSAAAASSFAVMPASNSATAGTAMNLTLQAKDVFGNIATGYTGTVHFTSTDIQAVLPTDYTFTAGDNGAHQFTGGLTLKTAGSRTVTATDTVNSTLSATSTSVTVSAAAAHQLGFSVQPAASTTAGVAFGLTVQVQDAYGNLINSGSESTANISLVLNGGSFASGSTATANAASGVAAFSNLKINTALSAYTISATASNLAGGTSSSFAIVPGAATAISFVQQPGNARIDSPITPAVTVKVVDQFNNPIAGATVNMAINSGPAGAAFFAGSTTSTSTDSTGTATFSNLAVNTPSGTAYTLKATSGSLSIISGSFNGTGQFAGFSNLAASQSVAYGAPSVLLSGTISGGGFPAPDGETVSITINGVTQNATTSGGAGGFIINYPAAAIPASVTPYTISYSYAGDASFTPASDSSTALTINRATPAISWSDPADIVYGTPLGDAQLDASTTIPGGLSYTPSEGTVLDAGAGQTLSANFTPDDSTDYTPASANVTINVDAAETSTTPQPASISFGQSAVALSAVVSDTQTAAAVNEGDVTFTVMQGSTVIGTVNSAKVANGIATATYSISGLAVGEYTVNATYNPAGSDADFAASNSTSGAVLSITSVPTVDSINTNGPSPTNAGSVSWTVNFSEPVIAGADGLSSLWNQAAPVSPVQGNDGQPIEVGTEFTSAANGYISGLRFYENSSDTGTHVGFLYDPANPSVPLASVTFAEESGSAWQTALFSSPVAITAGKTYIVSYYSSEGYYVASPGYFASSSFSSGPLTATTGAYLYGTSEGFPSGTYPSNYWVDPLFSGSAPVTPLENADISTAGSFFDGQSIEIGTQFTSSESGAISGVRFLKNASDTGMHVGQLFDAANPGTPLASVTFANETASGWQEAAFSTPVNIIAGHTYMIALYSSAGYYQATPGGLGSPISNGPLTATGGAYVYNPFGGFPSNPTDANYWVDAVFVPQTPAADDFQLTGSGASGAAITSVDTSGGSTWIVTATTAGDGTLGLNLIDNDSIADAVTGAPLGGPGTSGPADGSVTGENYLIDKTAPVAVNDLLSVAENSTLTLSVPGILGNDTDAEPVSDLTAALVTGPAHGTLTLNSNGSLQYIPTAGFSGSDSFTYTAADMAGNVSAAATVSITITPVPIIDSLHISPATPTTDSILSANVTGHDDNGHTVSYTYQWFKNGNPIGSATGSTLDLSVAGHGDKGDQISVQVTPHDGALAGQPMTALAVTVADSAPVMSTVTIAPANPTTDQTLIATPSATDADGDSVSFAFQWLKNGQPIANATTSTLDLSVLGNGDKGDSITVQVTPSDGTLAGTPMVSAASTVADSAPVMSTVTIAPANPTTNQVLTATPSATDADGDSVSFAFQWLKNGQPIANATTSTLDLSVVGNGDRGDQITVKVTPSDGTLAGAAMTSAASTVADSAPVMGTITITPANPEIHDVLTANPVASDADGDAIGYTYQWFDNGTLLMGATNSSLDAGSIGAVGGDQISVEVTPSDGTLSGTAMSASTVVADRTPPVVSLTAPAGLSNDNDPEFTGTAGTEAGDLAAVTINIYSGNSVDAGALVETLTADAVDGAFAVTPPAALADGTYTVQATQADASGNVGASAADTFTIDTVPPTVNVTLAAGQKAITNQEPISFDVIFSEPVADFAAGEVNVSGAAGGTGTVQVSGSGEDYTVTVDAMSSEGDVEISIPTGAAHDAAGNANTASNSQTVAYDTTAPAAPEILSLDPDTGRSSSDFITNDPTPTVDGSAEPGSTVVLSVDGNALPAVTAGTDGSWSVAITVPLSQGPHTLDATATDAAGNESEDRRRSMSTDNQAPIAPELDASSGITNAGTYTVTGTAEAGAIVQVWQDVGGTGVWDVADPVVGSQELDADGTEFSISIPLSTNAVNDFVVTATDVAGNMSAAAALVVTQDSVPPVISDVSATPAYISPNGDGVQDTVTIDYSLSKTASVTIGIYDSENNLVATLASGAEETAGGHQVTWDGVVEQGAKAGADGGYSAGIAAIDAAGNAAVEQTATFTIDDTPPTAVVALSGTSPTDGHSVSWLVTFDEAIQSVDAGDFSLQTTGTAAADADATVTLEGQNSYLVTFGDVNGDGTMDLAIDAAAISDLAGNPLTPPAPVPGYTIDHSAPVTSITGITPDTGISSTDGITNGNEPVLIGFAEPGSLQTISLDGSVIGTITADATTGAWSLALTSTPLADGTYTASVFATDAAGNSSAPVDYAFTVDTSAPEAPVIGAISPDSGGSDSDGVTDTGGVTLAGTAEAGATVAVLESGNSLGTATADANGDWSLTLNLPEGVHTLTATATDAAGNASDASATATFTVDTTPPSAAINPPATATFGEPLTLTGTASDALSGLASVQVTIVRASDGTVLAQGDADVDSADGTWSFIYTPAETTDQTIEITATDIAGNQTPITQDLPVQKATPVISWSNPDAIVYGTALGDDQLNATASASGEALAGAFVYSAPTGTVLHAGEGQTLSVTFTPEDSADYSTVQAQVTIDVAKAPLTINADDQNKTFGDADPALTASYDGFVNGDSAASLSHSVDLSVEEYAGYAGQYTINAADAASPDYTITYQTGTLTVAPAVLAISGLADQSGSEGSGVNLPLGSIDDTGWQNPTYNVQVDFGDGTSTSFSTDSAGSFGSVLKTYADNGDYTITVTVNDGHGESDTQTFAADIANVPPTLTLWGDSGVNEGSPYTLTLASADPGTDTLQSWTIDWGDGTAPQTIPAGTVALDPETGLHESTTTATHTYADGPNTYTISATATDEDGTYPAGNSVDVAVANVAPTPTITPNPENIYAEGQALQFTASSTDPGADDTVNYSWAAFLEGDPDRPIIIGNQASFTFTPPDNGDYTVSLTATDNDGGANTVTDSFSIANTPPTVSIQGETSSDPAPISGVEGTPIAFSSIVTDPSPADEAAGFAYAWTITRSTDGGHTFQPFDSGTDSTYTLSPNAAGIYELTLTATDKDGGTSTAAVVDVQVAVANPSVSIDSVSSPQQEGTPITVSGSAMPPAGIDESVALSWQVLKDGSDTPFATGAGSQINFTPDDNGSYQVVLTGTTPDGGTDSVQQTVAVANVPPALSLSGDSLIQAGVPYQITLASSDPGDDTVSSWTVNWGDGSDPQVVTASARSFDSATGDWVTSTTVSHVFTANGQFTVSASATDEDGTYGAGNSVDVSVEQAAVVSRLLFYKDSSFDQNGNENAAIATDKTALLPGQTATFANYSSYTDGINGIMVDISGTVGTISAADFEIAVGNDNTPAGWATGPTPTLSVLAGAGADGSTRIELTWDDGSITNEWVQVTVLGNLDTGLAANDVFYFGNAVGDTGDSASDAQVTSADEDAVRDNQTNFLTGPATVTDPYDFNRDGKVDATDEIIARANATTAATALQLIAPVQGLNLMPAIGFSTVKSAGPVVSVAGNIPTSSPTQTLVVSPAVTITTISAGNRSTGPTGSITPVFLPITTLGSLAPMGPTNIPQVQSPVPSVPATPSSHPVCVIVSKTENPTSGPANAGSAPTHSVTPTQLTHLALIPTRKRRALGGIFSGLGNLFNWMLFRS